MTDPIQGSQLAMQSIQKLDGAELDKTSPQADGPSFKEVMSTHTDPAKAPERPAAVEASEQVDPAKKLDDFVQGVFEDQARIEEMMGRCVDGKNLSQGELLQLQGLIYAYAQKVDLASKVVDKATGGLKQVMNTQV